METRHHQATRLLDAMDRGDPSAAEQLLPLVYDELRAIAGGYFRRQPSGHTLQPTALVHDAYAKLVGGEDAARFRGQEHFLAVAATAMRQILVDRARRRATEKHGGGRQRLQLQAGDAVVGQGDEIDLIALDDALRRLTAMDARRARIVELRFFAGLDQAQTADVLGISRSTVVDDWRLARAWLKRELEPP